MLVRTNAQTQGLEQALAQAGDCRSSCAARSGSSTATRYAGLSACCGLPPGRRRRSDPAAQVRPILASIGLTPQPPGGRGTARDRWESLESLAQLADDFFAASPEAGLADLAAELAVRSAIGHAPAMAGVTLASLHAAKGLEWQVVFLPGLTDGTVPIIYAQTDEAVEEERRLLYVGVTRARERLYLSWSLARSPGGRRTRKPSRFLADLTGRAARGPVSRAARPRRGREHERDPGRRPAVRAAARMAAGVAKDQGVPAYVVFSDATLQAIAARRPASRSELAGVPGVGAVKLDRYGAAVLELCADAGRRAAGAASRGSAMSAALDEVIELLDLEQIEHDIFRGESPAGERRQRVFGGQVAGQALVAAGRTVPADRPVHSLHAYFIRPGDPAVPLVYLVERVRDGRSFTTRRVTTVQHGKTIFTLSASFHRAEPGLRARRRRCPPCRAPEEIEPTARPAAAPVRARRRRVLLADPDRHPARRPADGAEAGA